MALRSLPALLLVGLLAGGFSVGGLPAPTTGTPGATADSYERVVRPVLVHPTGFRMSPYADIKPAGEDSKVAPRKLWHSSSGSSGH